MMLNIKYTTMEELKQKIEARKKLSPPECFELLESQDIELIRRYIGYDHFDNQSEPEFIKLGYVNLIEIYIRRYVLGPSATKELEKLGNPDLMELYNHLYIDWD